VVTQGIKFPQLTPFRGLLLTSYQRSEMASGLGWKPLSVILHKPVIFDVFGQGSPVVLVGVFCRLVVVADEVMGTGGGLEWAEAMGDLWIGDLPVRGSAVLARGIEFPQLTPFRCLSLVRLSEGLMRLLAPIED